MANLIYQSKSPETIRGMFSKIAPSYDKGNSYLSLNMHHMWNKALARKVSSNTDVKILLDLCCGTAEVTRQFLFTCYLPEKLYCIDFCPEMLTLAKEKFSKFPHPPTEFIEGDAQDIPLKENSVDGITLSYGIRNVNNPLKCIQECARVLKPGGTLGILELTRPSNFLLRSCHKMYLQHILPFVGNMISKDKEAYSYLSKSIEHFIAPSAMNTLLTESSLDILETVPLLGGISHIFLAQKKPS